MGAEEIFPAPGTRAKEESGLWPRENGWLTSATQKTLEKGFSAVLRVIRTAIGG
jgi:hypothetical protein